MTTNYENPQILDEYLLFHYGKAADILPTLTDSLPSCFHDAWKQSLDFPRRSIAHFSSEKKSRALDIGCAVGASTFSLASHHDEVIGIDYSHQFIQAAQALARGEKLRVHRHIEARLQDQLTISLPENTPTFRVKFLQGDAHQLPQDLGVFDRIHAANLLCRMRQPQLLLEQLPHLLHCGGELILTTPCTWLEEYTPPANMPQADTFTWLKEILSPHFSLEKMTHEPFLIRETARKFQWSLAMLTLWKRR